MWKKIQDSPNYYIKFIEENGYDIYITDYISIWFIRFTRNEFLKCLEESNEGLEYSNEEDFLRKGSSILSDLDKLRKKCFERKENGNILEITLSIFIRYTLKLKCKLSKGSEQLFYDKITKPLLKKIHNLNSSQNELIALLKKKDDEIFAYKSKGEELSLISVKTKEFNEDTHLSRHNLSETNFEQYEILQTTDHPMTEEIHVKQETESCNNKIKPEQNSSVKIEQQPNHELPSNGCASRSVNLISIDNIKQEVEDHSQITTDIQVKRRRKKLNL